MDKERLPWPRGMADTGYNLVRIKYVHSSLRKGAVNMPDHPKITLNVK